MYRLCHSHYILHQVAHIDCSAPSGKHHEPLTGVWGIGQGLHQAHIDSVEVLPHFEVNHPPLTHWGRVTHICVSKLTIIGSDNGLSPGRRQAIIWTNAGTWLNRPLETKFSEILIKIHIFLFTKIHLKMASGKWRPFCLGLNELRMVQGMVSWLSSAWKSKIM